MSTDFERLIRLNSERIADLRKATAEIEREVTAARRTLDDEFSRAVRTADERPVYVRGACRCGPGPVDPGTDPESAWVPVPAPREPFGYDIIDPECPVHGPGPLPGATDGPGPAFGAGERAAEFIDSGRAAGRRPLPHRGALTAGAVLAVVLIAVLVVALSGGGPGWPSSVGRVQAQIAVACQNPDVRSEPGQVNFACATATRPILWVFSLITSDNDAHFADPKTGRLGLEPITPAQGGEVAAWLNLHHPYDPTNPVDSLQVAARAINGIIGGTTVTGANGTTVVQPGLESSAANCARYTGSAALSARQGYPDVCARPVSSPAGRAALVADVFRKWMTKAPAAAASDAAVLFRNAGNPGDPRVQAILRRLPIADLSS